MAEIKFFIELSKRILKNSALRRTVATALKNAFLVKTINAEKIREAQLELKKSAVKIIDDLSSIKKYITDNVENAENSPDAEIKDAFVLIKNELTYFTVLNEEFFDIRKSIQLIGPIDRSALSKLQIDKITQNIEQLYSLVGEKQFNVKSEEYVLRFISGRIAGRNKAVNA